MICTTSAKVHPNGPGWYAGLPTLSQHNSQSVASEEVESVASQLQPVKSAELLEHKPVVDLDTLQGGSMMPLPRERSRSSKASGYATSPVQRP